MVESPINKVINKDLIIKFYLLPLLFVVQIVETVGTVAEMTELAVRETVTVQLQALRFGAVARLPRSHSVRFEKGAEGFVVSRGLGAEILSESSEE